MSRTGVFIGRFQPFHTGHASVLRDILCHCDAVVVVIGSSEKSRTSSNPWTYEERVRIIQDSLDDEVLWHTTIVGLPDNESDDVWVQNLLKKIPTTSIVYTGNSWVGNICENNKIAYNWITPTISISATQIRTMLRRHQDVSPWTRVKELPPTTQ